MGRHKNEKTLKRGNLNEDLWGDGKKGNPGCKKKLV